MTNINICYCSLQLWVSTEKTPQYPCAAQSITEWEVRKPAVFHREPVCTSLVYFEAFVTRIKIFDCYILYLNTFDCSLLVTWFTVVQKINWSPCLLSITDLFMFVAQRTCWYLDQLSHRTLVAWSHFDCGHKVTWKWPPHDVSILVSVQHKNVCACIITNLACMCTVQWSQRQWGQEHEEEIWRLNNEMGY